MVAIRGKRKQPRHLERRNIPYSSPSEPNRNKGEQKGTTCIIGHGSPLPHKLAQLQPASRQVRVSNDVRNGRYAFACSSIRGGYALDRLNSSQWRGKSPRSQVSWGEPTVNVMLGVRSCIYLPTPLPPRESFVTEQAGMGSQQIHILSVCVRCATYPTA